MNGSLLGPSYTNTEIRSFLDSQGAKYQTLDEEELLARVTSLLAEEKVVGWMQDRMEFGPRALGARSILGDPRSKKMQQVMNLKIKFRESFRPFAPSVLSENTTEFFEMPEGVDSPYMLMVAPVQERQRLLGGMERMTGLQGIEKLNVPRSNVPAITHVDFSARIQTVTPEVNGRYYRLIAKFRERTGCPMLVNTSFNIRGEPIVCTPQDAYRCFMGTHMDALVLENTLLLKEEQPDTVSIDGESYKSSFSLD